MLTKIMNKLNKLKKGAVSFALLMASSFSFAAMPTVESSSSGAGASSGFFEFLTSWIEDILVWTPLGLMSVATLWVGWSLLVKVLNERQAEKPNWGNVFVHAVGCILLLVVTVYLGNQTINVWA